MKKLNLGCGLDIKSNYINLDSKNIDGVDVIHDLNKVPLPFSDNSFDEVYAKDILEHIDYIQMLKELHRILKEDGIIFIQVPHFTSVNNYIDPTHKSKFSIRTFDFFTESSHQNRNYYFDFSFKEINHRKITFNKSIFYFFNYAIEPLINMNLKAMNYYESTGLCNIFPAQNIILQIKK